MRLSEAPTKIKPYVLHGVELYSARDDEHIGTCPFCEEDDKFHINEETGQYSCFKGSCDNTGNIYTFIRAIHERSVEECEQSWYDELSAQRGISTELLKLWGVTRSYLSDQVVVPMYGVKKTITNLCMWAKDNKTGKNIMYSTPTLKQGLFGLNAWDEDCENVIIAEGVWTAAAIQQMLSNCKGDLLDDSTIIPTRNLDASMFNKYNVVGVPGCGNFRDVWVELFADKNVIIAFDNDYPNKTTRKIAGWEGTVRTCRILSEAENKPKEMFAVKWGKSFYDPNLPKGYDFRDALIGGNDLPLSPSKALSTSSKGLKLLRGRLTPLKVIEPENANTRPEKKTEITVKKSDIQPVHCETFREVQQAWKGFFKWTDNLDCTLSFMMSVIASTPLPGTQLWGRIYGPPGSGKSRLCEAVSVSKKTVYPLSSLTGLHSGAKTKDGKSCSLIPDMNGHCVVIKDADTLREAGNISEILAEKRDLFDGVSRKRYRTETETQEHADLRITFLIAGTNTMNLIDPNSAARGARYLDSIIYKKGDNPKLEADILRRSAVNAMKQMRTSSDSDEVADVRMIRAYELTAGYLNYLRDTIEDSIQKIEVDNEYVDKCITLGELVGFMRARPDKQMEDEEDETELGTRLTEQFVRLMNCETVVLNKSAVDEEVMRRVVKIAKDTSRGLNYTICSLLAKYPRGLEGKTIASLISKPTQKANSICRYMSGVGILVRGKKHNSNTWKLSDQVTELMEKIKEDGYGQD